MIWLKVLAHIVTCIGLSSLLKNEFDLTGALFWVCYLGIATTVWVINMYDIYK